MPEVSAAIVVLAGAVLICAGVVPSPMTEESRHKLVGAGYLLAGLGFLAWALAFIVAFVHAAKAM
jgi:hypothetical protein